MLISNDVYYNILEYLNDIKLKIKLLSLCKKLLYYRNVLLKQNNIIFDKYKIINRNYSYMNDDELCISYNDIDKNNGNFFIKTNIDKNYNFYYIDIRDNRIPWSLSINKIKKITIHNEINKINYLKINIFNTTQLTNNFINNIINNIPITNNNIKYIDINVINKDDNNYKYKYKYEGEWGQYQTFKYNHIIEYNKYINLYYLFIQKSFIYYHLKLLNNNEKQQIKELVYPYRKYDYIINELNNENYNTLLKNNIKINVLIINICHDRKILLNFIKSHSYINKIYIRFLFNNYKKYYFDNNIFIDNIIYKYKNDNNLIDLSYKHKNYLNIFLYTNNNSLYRIANNYLNYNISKYNINRKQCNNKYLYIYQSKLNLKNIKNSDIYEIF
jgi:hypothetical protein